MGLDNMQFNSLSLMQAETLLGGFSKEKVKQAVLDCDNYKSPGPYGVHFGFVKEFWENIKAESQSAFVKGKQILDRILIANEVVDEAKKKKKELILFKVDFEKAYDSVEWDYLELVRANMASVFVLVNGSHTEEFDMRKGLRQGDPLSPFLFLIATEDLHALYSASVEANRFKGFKVESNEFRVFLLQFADDTLITGEKCWDNIRAIKANLLWFAVQFGLKVFWKPVIEKIRNRLAGRNSRTLSMGGRLLLLKVVLFALPVHWVNWEKVCLPLEKGGLGVRDLKFFNKALLGKWR
uniref:Uncharacterized protein LOC105852691 n=1 Tax=Cicer arietinum TaxID=3827 RepID=A0A1S3EFL2_CICAR|nr:uncharacterized protein LOC105852691 [Cicer arietinum]